MKGIKLGRLEIAYRDKELFPDAYMEAVINGRLTVSQVKEILIIIAEATREGVPVNLIIDLIKNAYKLVKK